MPLYKQPDADNDKRNTLILLQARPRTHDASAAANLCPDLIITPPVKYNNVMKKIMFCGGGSAGHVIPNIALCDQLKGSFGLCYMGTGGIESEICKSKGLPFYTFDGVKLVRGKIICNLSIPAKVHRSIKQCEDILKEVKPDLLFCKGGYASYPPAVAAAKMGIPVLTHESDISLGLANKMIAPKCRRVLTSFPSTAVKLKNGVYTGAPIRRELFGRDRIMAKRAFGVDLRPTVLVFGGGSGSKAINQCLRACISDICKKYNVLHICGRGNAVYSNLNGYRQIEYAEDMGEIYACADYAVSRCGANAAAELIALRIPTLFIPLENGASRGDQTDNADYFLKRGLCRVLHESMLTPSALGEEIDRLIADKQLKAALKENIFKRGNERIIQEILCALNEPLN